jgi:hypothetical protein
MYQALERKLQRETKKVNKNAPDTPRIISRQDLLEAGINPFKAAKLRNNLIMAYTLNEEIKVLDVAHVLSVNAFVFLVSISFP